jgi:hypothetical protein
MSLSQLLRKQLIMWQRFRKLDEVLEAKGLSMSFDECWDPTDGKLKFSDVRVTINVREAMPELNEFFIQEAPEPNPDVPAEKDLSDLDKALHTGFDVVTEQPGEKT